MRADAARGAKGRTRPDRRELAKADKLARIVAAATKLFDERGFEATTTAAITEAAGIGAGTLFLYVKSKDDLLVLVFREELSRIWDDAFAAVRNRGTLADQLSKLFGHVIAVHEQDPALTRAFLKELMFVSETERRGVTEFMDRWLDRLAALLAAAQERGALSPEVSPRVLANNLWSLYFHALQCRYGGYLSAAALPRRVKEAIELQLRGITPIKPKPTRAKASGAVRKR
jgi:AcrR family transcriptional regulator